MMRRRIRMAPPYPRSRMPRGLASVVWGERSRLGYTAPDGTVTDFNTINPFPQPCGVILPGGAVTNVMCRPPLPGVIDFNPQAPTVEANPLPGQITVQAPPPAPAPTPTVVVTPTSGTIPSPAQVAAATTPTGFMAWLQQSMFLGVPNWILLAGGAALLFSEGGHK